MPQGEAIVAVLRRGERILASGPGPDRQRGVHAIGGMPGLLADLVGRTTRGW